jgi:ATP-dependent RNA helicase RhlE
VEEDLREAGFHAVAIHGDKSQGARTRALNDFKRNKSRILVATDVASRGIDVDQLPYVINFDMPENAETYVHRIGRTGRAGATGKAISFCCEDDRDILREIEKHLKMTLNKNADHPFVLTPEQLSMMEEQPGRGGSSQNKGRSGGRGKFGKGGFKSGGFKSGGNSSPRSGDKKKSSSTFSQSGERNKSGGNSRGPAKFFKGSAKSKNA